MKISQIDFGSCLAEGVLADVAWQGFVLVGFAVVEAPFGFLAMEVEGVPRQSLELRQPDLGQAPEAFDAVDVNGVVGERVPGMIDAEVTVTEVDQAVATSPAVGVDDGTGVHPAANDALQGRP